ncbi:hypothetical protein AB0I99_22250 [Streptomyces spongiicola]
MAGGSPSPLGNDPATALVCKGQKQKQKQKQKQRARDGASAAP